MTKIKETSTNFANKKALADECPEIYASNTIGGQWALAICCYLINGKMRFGELRKKLQNITERMLTLQLRRLEEDKIITRTVYVEVPPRVEYELTDYAATLHEVLSALSEWGATHKEKIRKSMRLKEAMS